VRGAFTADLGPAGSLAVAAARAAVAGAAGPAGTGPWLRALMAHFRALVAARQGAPSPRDAWAALAPDGAMAEVPPVAATHLFCALCAEGFGIWCRPVWLVHWEPARTEHSVALVGPRRWVADAVLGVVPLGPGGAPASLRALQDDPALAAAAYADVPWRTPSGNGPDGFYRPGSLAPDKAPPSGAGFAPPRRLEEW